ncbi:hypothetical protein [Polyangium sp. 6x1]|uniref:hypothetical protein n=1 Tax=Polyangium sp. 6x1 TaxID=3042689 RepID=UPI002482642E|nr:hypothetical protein [Polyangium sp. 6x1]MDI1444627.1 hypothetical protein [Polyangium sp. 6x1]
MLNPRVPMTARESLFVARALVLAAPDPGAPSAALRYERDTRRRDRRLRAPDQWQRPEQTDAQGRGDCEDLMIRYAAFLARRRPILLCIVRTGARMWHYYLREIDGTILDPSVRHGMPAMRPSEYEGEGFQVRIDPTMFEMGEEGAGPVKADDAIRGFNTASQVTAVAATGLATVYPPAGAVAGVLSAALGLVGGAIEQAKQDALAKARARRAQGKKPRKAARPEKVITAKVLRAPPSRIRLAAVARGMQPVDDAAIKRAQDAMIVVGAAQAGEVRASAAVQAAMRTPVVGTGGEVNEAALAVRLALAHTALAAPPVDPDVAAAFAENPDAKADDVLDADDLDEDEEGSGACCEACAHGKSCEGGTCSAHGAEDDDGGAEGDDGGAEDDDDDDDDEDGGCGVCALAAGDDEDDEDDMDDGGAEDDDDFEDEDGGAEDDEDDEDEDEDGGAEDDDDFEDDEDEDEDEDGGAEDDDDFEDEDEDGGAEDDDDFEDEDGGAEDDDDEFEEDGGAEDDEDDEDDEDEDE